VPVQFFTPSVSEATNLLSFLSDSLFSQPHTHTHIPKTEEKNAQMSVLANFVLLPQYTFSQSSLTAPGQLRPQ